MDKSLTWRNKCINELIHKNNLPNINNQYISNIEMKLINIAAIVGLKRQDHKEDIAKLISNIQKQFIPAGLNFSMDNRKAEEFLSKYSDGLEDAFLYAKKMEDDIREGRITSEQQIMPIKKSFFKTKSKILPLAPAISNEVKQDEIDNWKSSLKYDTSNLNNKNQEDIKEYLVNEIDKGIEK